MYTNDIAKLNMVSLCTIFI